MTETPCPEAWHAGLHSGLLRECRFTAKHKGWHRDGNGLAWGGRLTAEERRLAEALRAAA